MQHHHAHDTDAAQDVKCMVSHSLSLCHIIICLVGYPFPSRTDRHPLSFGVHLLISSTIALYHHSGYPWPESFLREQRYKYSTKQSLPWTFLINFSFQKATFGCVCCLCGPRKASARTSAGIAGASHTYPVCTPFTSILTLPSPIGKYFLKKKKSNESEFIHLL